MSEKHIDVIASWKEFSLLHPLKEHSLSLQRRRYAWKYMNARICALSGDIESSRSIFDLLNQDEEYLKFEEKRADILAEIDTILEGHSRWQQEGQLWTHVRSRRI